jgi:NAD(P)-dependent dehydrogenase (short-subunit alcohol dehydrogenase family)
MTDNNYPLALITGAGKRLGRALAMGLANSGFAIVLHYQNSENEVTRTIKEIKLLGVPVYKIKADLTDEDDLEALFSYLETLPHKLKVLVNSAAIMHKEDLGEISIKEWDLTFGVNLRAPFILAQRAAELMPPGGLIVNISDAGAGKTWIRYPSYIISKSGLDTLTRILAKAYAPRIRVNSIAPGLVLASESVKKEDWEKLVDKTPIKRHVTEEEVVSTLEFLIQNEAITGQVIIVDGGYSLI